jgi:hypothetical protein
VIGKIAAGALWSIAFELQALRASEEARIGALEKQALS